MATLNSTPAIQLQHIRSANVIALPAPEITQVELTALLSLRNRARQLAEQVEAAESSVRERLEAGATVEAGEHTASLKESFRRSVAWREVAERLGDRLYGDCKGEGYCAKVLASTKPTRTVTLQIQ